MMELNINVHVNSKPENKTFITSHHENAESYLCLSSGSSLWFYERREEMKSSTTSS